MSLNPELRQLLDQKCTKVVAVFRGGNDESSHDPGHLERVGAFVIRLGERYGFAEQVLALGYVAGKTHDAKRTAGENPDCKDEEISAQVANRLLLDLNRSSDFVTSYRQRQAVMYAIEHQGEAPARFNDPATRNLTPPRLAEKLHLLLFSGDKIAEANGPWITARRPHFMASRLRNAKDGAWQEFGFIPDRDEALVTAAETAIRMAIVSVEETYPKQLKETIAPLFRVQREFGLGLYKALSLTPETVADLLLNRIDPETGKNILQKRKYKAPDNVVGLGAFIAKRSGLTNKQIASAEEDQANSAMETVEYFAGNHQKSLENLVQNWQPQGKMAQQWHQGMLWYLEGTLFDRLTI